MRQASRKPELNRQACRNPPGMHAGSSHWPHLSPQTHRGRRLQARAAHGTRGESAQIKVPVQRISPESGLITWIRANESTNSFKWRRRPSKLAWIWRIQTPIRIGRRTCRGGPTSGQIPAEDFFARHTHIDAPITLAVVIELLSPLRTHPPLW